MSEPYAMIIEYLGKPFDHPDYDLLLECFAKDNPERMLEWQELERASFINRRGLGAYPDQDLMKFCKSYLASRLIDERAGFAAFHAWGVLRGRILRSILEREPQLNPAPGVILITIPRTCSDQELATIADGFRRSFPELWDLLARACSDPASFSEDAISPVTSALCKFIAGHCWYTSADAITKMLSSIWEYYFSERYRY